MAPQIPEMQWAQVTEKPGSPVEYKQIPVPKPAPDEVLVNVKYSGVCHTDLHAMNGDWPLERKRNLVGGHEGAGVVVARGNLVSEINIGDHAGVKWLNGSCLVCEFCQQADEPLCPKASLSGYTVDGTFQQYCLAKATHVNHLPKDVPLDAIAPVLCAGITVYKGLKESGARPGQSVAIVGAGGGLGSLAQQYAKAMGLRIIAIDGGDEKRDSCKALGAEVAPTPPLLFPNDFKANPNKKGLHRLPKIHQPNRRRRKRHRRQTRTPRRPPRGRCRETLPTSSKLRPTPRHHRRHRSPCRRVSEI